MATVNPIPDDYPRVSVHLSVANGAEAIDFYKEILGATERMRMPMPDGKIAHAELQLGNSVLMIADESPDGSAPSPTTLGGTPVLLYTYVEDIDSVYRRAIEAGAAEVEAPANQFYGDRTAIFDDPFGHRWNIASHVEDVPPEEMEQRASAALAGN